MYQLNLSRLAHALCLTSAIDVNWLALLKVDWLLFMLSFIKRVWQVHWKQLRFVEGMELLPYGVLAVMWPFLSLWVNLTPSLKKTRFKKKTLQRWWCLQDAALMLLAFQAIREYLMKYLEFIKLSLYMTRLFIMIYILFKNE